MYFQHSSAIWSEFPELSAGVLFVEGVNTHTSVDRQIGEFEMIAQERLAGVSSESDLPEIQAWRRGYSRMGLKPTQYRCASESLLRRFRKDGTLPSIHPLIDLCNSVSLAYAIPVAVFDVSKIDDHIEVRHANGDETYLTFSDEIENPDQGEVVFADASGRLHARRWVNRQSGLSAIRDTTAAALIVVEALHDNAANDVANLTNTLATELGALWSVPSKPTALSSTSPRFDF